VSFAAITLRFAYQRVFIVVVVHFVIDSVRKLLDTPSCFQIIYYVPLFSDISNMSSSLRVRENSEKQSSENSS
jgi:hypothetical protein